jgi:glyoxylase-like metal-dependent hydrolase (beta-lactamase superfamily II)
MPLRFTVLASGSGGNASLLEADGFGLLLDAGLGPRQLAGRLAAVGASWQQVHAVLLTHTHSDQRRS